MLLERSIARSMINPYAQRPKWYNSPKRHPMPSERIMQRTLHTTLAMGLAWAMAACPGGEAGSIEDSAPTIDRGVPADWPVPGDQGVADRSTADRALSDGARTDRGRSDGSPPWSFTFYRVNHVLCTGQSLSIGSKGTPALSLQQPYDNRMFNTGVVAGGTGLSSLVPLVEATLETMSSGFANLTTKLAREQVFPSQPAPQNSHDLLVSCHGKGGTAYSGLKKGTVPYQNGLAQVTAGITISASLKQSYVVRAVTVVHGETDGVNKNAAYDKDLAQWQTDYEADVRALTKQKVPIPMLQSQISSWTKSGMATSLIPGAQLQASIDHPGKVILVGPKYFLPYSDGIHLTNEGYRQLGEHYAKVYRRLVLEGKTWEPLRPKNITRTGAVIRVVFFVPKPPLVLDTSHVSNPGHLGFEYKDDSASPPKIQSVALDGADAVKVTLAAAPTGNKRTLSYAWTGVVGNNGGPTTGPRGNLRDSDATPSRIGYSLYNWCVHFSQAVP
jgi:hypothetical protein